MASISKSAVTASFHAVQEFLGITFPPKPHPFAIKRGLYFSLYAPKDLKPGTPFDAGWPPSPLRFFDSLHPAGLSTPPPLTDGVGGLPPAAASVLEVIARLVFGLWRVCFPPILIRTDRRFGLWRVRFPPCLVRPGRRLPVQGLSEGSPGFLDRDQAAARADDSNILMIVITKT